MIKLYEKMFENHIACILESENEIPYSPLPYFMIHEEGTEMIENIELLENTFTFHNYNYLSNSFDDKRKPGRQRGSNTNKPKVVDHPNKRRGRPKGSKNKTNKEKSIIKETKRKKSVGRPKGSTKKRKQELRIELNEENCLLSEVNEDNSTLHSELISETNEDNSILHSESISETNESSFTLFSESIQTSKKSNELENYIFNNFTFRSYKKEDDDIVQVVRKHNVYNVCVIDSDHFGLSKRKEHDFKEVITFKENNNKQLMSVNKNSLKTIEDLEISDNKDIRYKTKEKLGKLMFGFELLCFNNGIRNFNHLLSLLHNYFKQEMEIAEPEKERDYIVNDFKKEQDIYYDKKDLTISITMPSSEHVNITSIDDYKENNSDDHSSLLETSLGTLIETETNSEEIFTNTVLDSTQHNVVESLQTEDLGSNSNDEEWEDDDEEELDNTIVKPKKKKVIREKQRLQITIQHIKDLISKDKSGLSDKKYKTFLTLSGAKLKSIKDIAEVRSIVNIATLLNYQVCFKDEIFYSNPLEVIKSYISSHISWVNRMLVDDSLCDCLREEDKDLKSKTFIFKFNLDAAGGEDGKVTFSIAPINLKSFGGHMSRESVIPLAVWDRNEGNFRKIANIYKIFIEAMLSNGVTVGKNVYKVDFILITDLCSLKSLSLISFQKMCPYCNADDTFCDHPHLKRSIDELGCILGLPPCKIVICLLHLKERICERLLIDSILISNKINIIEAIRKIPSFKRFNISEKQGSKGKKYIKCYLTGRMCNELLKNLQIIKNSIPKPLYKLLVLLRKVIRYLEMVDITPEKLKVLNERISQMKKEFLKIYLVGKPKCWYLHILFHHVNDILEAYGSLKIFETQNFESAHIDDNENLLMTSKNGGRKSYLNRIFPESKNLMLVQLLLRKLRLLFLCDKFNKYGFSFVSKRIKKTEKYKEFLQKNYPNIPMLENSSLKVKFQRDVDLYEDNICTNCKKHISVSVDSQYNPSQDNSQGVRPCERTTQINKALRKK